MKNIFFVAIVMLCIQATSLAQTKTPKAVIDAFNQKFSNATKVKWDKENAHEYEASFEWNGQKHSANFTDVGEWLETESPMTFIQLPTLVQEKFNVAHKGATIKDVAKIETSKNTVQYEVEIKQGAKTIELFYDPNGVEIK